MNATDNTNTLIEQQKGAINRDFLNVTFQLRNIYFIYQWHSSNADSNFEFETNAIYMKR